MRNKFNIFPKIPQGVDAAKINQAAQLTLEKFKPQDDWQINLIFVSKTESRKLNKKYGGNDYPTDVLSFNYQEGKQFASSRRERLGEVVICLPIASSQADRFEIDLTSEICTLTVHGILHLFGEDHQSKHGQARFEKLQSAIMDKLKLKFRTQIWQ